MGKNPSYLPTWAQSVGAIKAEGAVVNVMCGKCQFFRPADLDAIIAKFGEDFDLSDRSPTCPTPGCGHKVIFHYGPSQGTPTRPLRKRR